MEIQQKDTKTLTANVHCLKTEAKWFVFDNDTVAICIFVKGLWNAHTTAAMFYEKDHQTFSEVIKITEKFNAAQQLTAMMTGSLASMMSNDDRCFVCG